ncbi:hypothetical protein E2C01_007953 [Portunus trituberculatus]|uniref:Uncharacterized protein n=1 Tax=Portunus trituberculatus TaxID=210409 RepID=A0A5B7D0H9_PORTR|nr:hypothetical protein [Portunus trituberculatus]
MTLHYCVKQEGIDGHPQPGTSSLLVPEGREMITLAPAGDGESSRWSPPRSRWQGAWGEGVRSVVHSYGLCRCAVQSLKCGARGPDRGSRELLTKIVRKAFTEWTVTVLQVMAARKAGLKGCTFTRLASIVTSWPPALPSMSQWV